MRIEVDFQGGKNSAGLFVHKKLSQSMGYSTAAFAQSVLRGQTQPGVWYPEEKEALQVRARERERCSSAAARSMGSMGLAQRGGWQAGPCCVRLGSMHGALHPAAWGALCMGCTWGPL